VGLRQRAKVGTEGRRRHRGDIMSPEKRSALMSRIRGRDTGPERALAVAMGRLGLTWESHSRDLPGRPDFVFRRGCVAVFVEGDFWHGWRFGIWRDKLSERWEAKIEANRRRDAKSHRHLRRLGWRVLRVWEHQLERDAAAAVDRIVEALRAAGRPRPAAARSMSGRQTKSKCRPAS
jgi:DNA mismatch endonuclease (patch repair protein)